MMGPTLQLVFMVCSLLEGGGKCYFEAPMILQEGTQIMGCMIAGQQEGAKYVADHPNRQIVRIICEPIGRYSRL